MDALAFRLDSLLADLDQTVQVNGDISDYVIQVEGAIRNVAGLNDPNTSDLLQALQDILQVLRQRSSSQHQIVLPPRIYRGRLLAPIVCQNY